MKSRRLERINSLLREEISEIIKREVKDPRVKMISIVEVRVTSDLQFADIYCSIIGEKEEIDKAMEGLNSASGFIYYRLKKKLDLRFIPSLTFKYIDLDMTYASS